MKMSVPPWRRVEHGGIAALLKGEQLQPASLTVSMWDGTGWDNSLQQIQARPLVTEQLISSYSSFSPLFNFCV